MFLKCRDSLANRINKEKNLKRFVFFFEGDVLFFQKRQSTWLFFSLQKPSFKAVFCPRVDRSVLRLRVWHGMWGPVTQISWDDDIVPNVDPPSLATHSRHAICHASFFAKGTWRHSPSWFSFRKINSSYKMSPYVRFKWSYFTPINGLGWDNPTYYRGPISPHV